MYEVAIPSWGRPKIIEKSLNLLKKYNIDKSKITIFLEDEEQLELYKDLDYKKVLTHTEDIGTKREFMKNYYEEGTHLLSLDDDIEIVKEMIDKKNGKEIDDLNLFVENAFKMCEEKGLYIWGVYPVDNYYFMNKNFSTDLKFICSAFYGYIVRHSLDFTGFKVKDDYNFCIQHFIKDGGVLRFNYITYKTKYFCKTGGITERLGERVNISKIEALMLKEKYPKFVSTKIRKNGMWEVRLKGGRNKKPKIFVISMDNKIGSERREQLGYKFNWFKANEYKDVKQEIKDKMIHLWNAGDKRRQGKEGCFDSWIRLLQKIIDKKINNVILTEDDCFLKQKEFNEFYRSPPKEICYLAGSIINAKNWKEVDFDYPKNIGLNEIDYTKFRIMGTWGFYIPHYKDAENLLEKILDQKRFRGLDVFLNRHKIIKKYYYPSLFITDEKGKSQIENNIPKHRIRNNYSKIKSK